MSNDKYKQNQVNMGIFEKANSAGVKLSYIILLLIVVIVFIPILITIFASFKNMGQIGADFPLKPPSDLSLKNYIEAFTSGNILLGLKNVVIIAFLSIGINILLGSMLSFCLARFEFRFKSLILVLFLLAMMIPANLTEISRFGIISKIHLYNTIFAPIIIYIAANIMQIYIYLQYMEKIPVSLDESAMIDGCTYFGVYFKIIFPLIIPASATVAILNVVTIFNDMYIPYLYMPAKNLRTMTTVLMAYTSSQTGQWTIVSAAIIIVMVPTIILYLAFQKYIFAGMVAGAIKE